MTPDNWRITGDMALAVVCLIGALLLFIGAADLPPPGSNRWDRQPCRASWDRA